MTEMTTPWAGDAMDTLKMKIGLITKESKESSIKMEKAEKAKAEADERIAAAEKKIKELSKAIHARKIMLDENTDKLLRNTSMAKKEGGGDCGCQGGDQDSNLERDGSQIGA